MSKPFDFIVRSKSEVRKNDVVLGPVTLGDRAGDMYRAWCDGGGKASLYYVGAFLFARGSKEDRTYAQGFFDGWRRALRIPIEDDE